nr:MAG: putative structural protein [Locarnavirus sp.]
MCQSCAAKLDLRQCVCHLDTPVSCVQYTPPLPSISEDEEYCKLHLQSDEASVVLGGSELPESTATAVAEFLDETPGTHWNVSSTGATNLQDVQPHVELAKFLSRPVLINSFVWSQTDSYVTTTSINPWYLFFNSTPIKSKLNNYSFINCKLKVKFVINASPFYAGALRFSYSPLQTLNGNTIKNDGGGELIPYSQRPGVWIYPQTCSGGEITLPFFYHKNWLDVTSAADTQAMGLFTPCLFAPLTSANGVTGTSVVINIYAWAEDIKLHAPTTKLALQSDEFDYKPSQIASAVSAAARSLERVPILGPYMKATSMVAGKVGKAASALGFTNVPNMDTVVAQRPAAFPHNATCEVSLPTDRTVVDSKNEVSLDPRTVGLDGTDELSLAYIAGRESYIGTAILSSSDSVDKLTMGANVTPAILFSTDIANQQKPVQFTPMGYLCNMFKYWRGDIIYRFKFICTRFHKGRVRITWDPKNNITTSVPDYTTVFNEVIDIGAEQDIEIRVPYSQDVTFLPTYLNNGNFTMNGSSLTLDTYSNGIITMRVVNPLSGPLATSSVAVLVFARAADNIEYAVPHNPLANNASTMNSQWTPYDLQSGELVYPVAPRQVVVGNEPTIPDPNRYLVHFGEKVSSLRPLIHRMYRQYQINSPPLVTGTNINIVRHKTSRRNKYFGYSTDAYWTGNKTVGVGTAKMNYIRCSVPQLVSLLFVGQRGSITHQYNIETSTYNPYAAFSNVTLSRYDGTISPGTQFITYDNNVTTSANIAAAVAMKFLDDPYSGVALTDQRLQPAITVNFPYYSNYNFQFVNPAYADKGSAADGSDVDNVILTINTAKGYNTNAIVPIQSWTSLGPDYNFFFFLNCPSLYGIAIPDAP